MSLFVRAMIVVLGFAIGVAAFSIPYLNTITAVENRGEVKISDQIFLVDVAHDAQSRTKGLSGRDHLDANEGMLFLFDTPDKYGFWMKDMKVPIDIVWIHNNAIVGINEYVFPEPNVPDSALTVYYPPEPVDAVLEIAAGRARSLHAKVGDPVKMRPLIKTTGSLTQWYGTNSY